MANKFRKSLFGYNCEEVSLYLQKKSEENAKVQNNLKEKISAQNQQISDITANLNDTKTELENYKEKYNEIKNLSDNIGKLYLVAQTNARSIINTAKQAEDTAVSNAKHNVELIDNADESIHAIKTEIEEMSRNFVEKLNELSEKLNTAKSLITDAELNTKEKSEMFDSVFSEITNG